MSKTAKLEIEALLTKTWGAPIQLSPFELLEGRTHVARTRVIKGPAKAPETVIIKTFRSGDGEPPYDPETGGQRASPAGRLFNDWAGLLLMTHLQPEAPFAPRVYAGSREQGWIVIEDIPGADPVEEALLGADSAQAVQELVRMAGALGAFHAATQRQETQYQALRESLITGKPPGTDFTHFLEKAKPVFLDAGLEWTSQMDTELSQALARLAAPGPFSVLVHGDAIPGNWKQTDNRLRLIDFEGAWYQHALLEGSGFRYLFPTGWRVGRIPEPVWRAAENTYRDVLLSNQPEIDPRTFGQALTDAGAFWLLATATGGGPTLEFALRQDHPWSITSIRQRFALRYHIFSQTTREFGWLEPFGEAVARLVDQLCNAWAVDLAEVPYYPAFENQAS